MSMDEYREAVRRRARERVADAVGPASDGSDVETNGEIETGGDETVEVGATTAAAAGSGMGRAYLERMIESGNAVMQNPFGEPVVEIVAPVGLKERINGLVDKWDLNPRGHGVIAQAPSFADQQPEIAEDLVAWQFLLADGEEDDIKSCGYDVPAILDELDDAPIMCTVANRVQASVPIE